MFESDRAHDTLPPSVVAELRRAVPPRHTGGRAGAIASIMAAVHAAPTPHRAAARARFSLRPVAPRWARRGIFSPSGAALVACLTLCATWLGAIGDAGRVRARETLADSAARVAPAVARLVRPGVLRDSLLDRALVLAIDDTLRVVRFVLDAPSASRVALVGDFTGWATRAVPLHRDGERWAADVALVGGRHRYGFVVDDTQWVARGRDSRALPDTL
jgi:hypothetical protein